MKVKVGLEEVRVRVRLEFEMETESYPGAAGKLIPLVGEANKLARPGTIHLACWNGEGEPPRRRDEQK